MSKRSSRRYPHLGRENRTDSSGVSADASPGAVPGSSFLGSSLILQKKPQRLAALLHEHSHLLSKIKQRKAEQRRLEEHITSVTAAARSSALPLIEGIMELDGQLHGLFRELLARKGQPRKTQKTVRSVYGFLQALGEISPAAADADPGAQGRAAASAEPAPRSTSDEEAEAEIPPWATGGVTARRPGPQHQGTASSLRSLFHRLAEALHPDKVQDEQEKEERTDVMKELTQAYQAGDLARLIELERTWLGSADRADERRGTSEQTEEEDLERRCAQLEKTNQALRLQLAEVNRALRELRRAPHAEFVSELRRMARGSKKDPVTAWVDSLREQHERLTEVLAFVRSYEEGRIDIREFERGPQTGSWGDEEPGADELDLLQEILDGLAAMAQSPRSRRRSRRASQPRDTLG